MAELKDTVVSGSLRVTDTVLTDTIQVDTIKATNGTFTNINGVAVGNSPKFTDSDTTYTFAEGSTNGAFSVTPSGGSTSSINVHGVITDDEITSYQESAFRIVGAGDTIVSSDNITDVIPGHTYRIWIKS